MCTWLWTLRLVLAWSILRLSAADGPTDNERLLIGDGSWHRGQRKRVAFETSCYYAQEPELPQGCQYSRKSSTAWRDDPIREEERGVLMYLYEVTGGSEWRANENWGWDTDPCWDQWYGVTCDEHGHVIALDLVDNKLVGQLPSSLGRLRFLLRLDLSSTAPDYHSHPNVYRNRLDGPLPSLSECGRIEEIEVSGNLISELPEDLWKNGPTLRSLSASHNNLTDLPKFLRRLVKLHTLELGHNAIDDEFPRDFGYLDNVRFVQMEYNQLRGEIPANIVGMRRNRVLDLSHNLRLTGELPKDLIIEWKEQDYLAILNTSIVGYISSLCLDVPFCWKFMYDTHPDMTWATVTDVPDVVAETIELAKSNSR